MLTYNQVHYQLTKQRGDASNYTCPGCGQPAKDWAYQHNGDPELYEPTSGHPYSEDLEHCYVAMCRSCHLLGDVSDVHRRLGKLVGRSNKLRADLDSEFAAKVSVDRANAARQANKIQRKCNECPITAHPAALGAHQRGSGHRGYTEMRNA
jgi:hypothetical protein